MLNPLFMRWIDGKINSNILPILIWILLRATFVVTYYIIDLDVSTLSELYGANASDYFICKDLAFIDLQSDTSKYIAIALAIAYVLFTLCLDVFGYIRMYFMKTHLKASDLNGKKKIITNTSFYIISNTFLQILFFICFTIYLLVIAGWIENGHGISIAFFVVRAIIPILLLWTVVYFLQLVPAVGPSIISIQGMYLDLMKFVLLFVIFTVPFIHTFQTYMLYNSRDGCHPDFSAFQVTFYTLFQLMLIDYDTNELNINNSEIFQFLHVLFVFNIGVLLLNFLIATMANRATTIEKNKNVTLRLNQLALAVRVEDRVYWCSRWLYKYLRRFGFHCEGGRVFIIHEESRLDTLSDVK